jgi:hypothetical protein
MEMNRRSFLKWAGLAAATTVGLGVGVDQARTSRRRGRARAVDLSSIPGATPDGGITDNGPFLQDALNASSALGVPVYIPPTRLGYGVKSTTRPPSGSSVHGDGSFIVNRGTGVGGIPNAVFFLEDVSDVEIFGLSIDGGATVRQAVVLTGTCTDITLSGLHLSNHRNFAISAGAIGTAGTCRLTRLRIDSVVVDGTCGQAGAGSGIDLFPEDQIGHGRAAVPASSDVSVTNLDVDVTNGSRNVESHGPQCFKASCVNGLAISRMRLKGGSVCALDLVNGVRDVAATDIATTRTGTGLIVTDENSGSVTAWTQAVRVSNFTYDPQTATGIDPLGFVIGQPESLTITNFVIKGGIVFRSGGQGNVPRHVELVNGVVLRTMTSSVGTDLPWLHLQNVRRINAAGRAQAD